MIINWLRRLLAVLLFFLLLGGVLVLGSAEQNGAPDALQTDEQNLFWPAGRVFPAFAAPEGPLVAFPGDLLPGEEMPALACLQGFANAVCPRAVILDGDVREWLDEYGFSYETATRENAYAYIKDLATGSVAGAVLYSTERSPEYLNLASSVGNTMKGVPLTPELYEKWQAAGVDLPVLADLTGLTYTKTADIYRYLFDNYWNQCTHRVLVIQRTDLKYHMRDLASAVGGAVVYLSCAGGEETELFKRFLNTMTPGESILTGWYAGQEKELMSAAAQCGLSCVPSDFFSNATVFGQKQEIEVPSVPDQPKLENKIYIAYFLSDGDNVQYNMHAMRGYWNANAAQRGRVAVNWTISPALADLAPGMMNYYYRGATDKECFVCGPSGLGYTVPVNTFGDTTGNQFKSNDKFAAYVQMTDRYLQRTGLRVVTIWDNLTAAQRKIYADEGDYLYGLTVQHFTNSSLWLHYTGVTNNMLFIQLTPAYFASNPEGTTPLTQVENDIKGAVKYLQFDGKGPVFVATQIDTWAFHNIADVVALERDLSEYYTQNYGRDVVEFVRADHFYNLYYEAHALPQDVTLQGALSATATSNSDAAILTTDGACRGDSLWTAGEAGEQSLTYDLGDSYSISEVDLYHAEAAGLDAALNTRAFRIEISEDGEHWTKAAEVMGNTALRSVVKFKAVSGSFVKITITDPGEDGVARLADVDLYGVAADNAGRCPQCGKLHQTNLFDRFAGFLHRIYWYMTHLFH